MPSCRMQRDLSSFSCAHVSRRLPIFQAEPGAPARGDPRARNAAGTPEITELGVLQTRVLELEEQVSDGGSPDPELRTCDTGMVYSTVRVSHSTGCGFLFWSPKRPGGARGGTSDRLVSRFLTALVGAAVSLDWRCSICDSTVDGERDPHEVCFFL